MLKKLNFRLCNMVEELFSFQFFFLISLMVFQITITLYVLTEKFWLIGYVLMAFQAVQILLMCLFGQILINKASVLMKLGGF